MPSFVHGEGGGGGGGGAGAGLSAVAVAAATAGATATDLPAVSGAADGEVCAYVQGAKASASTAMKPWVAIVLPPKKM